MNIFGIIILVTLLLDFILEAIGDYLNIRHLSNDLPKEFEGVYSPEKYELSQKYLKERTTFSYFGEVPGLIITLAFWFLGGFAWLDTLVSAYSANEILRGLMYIGALGAAQSILGLPFGIWSVFVIEKKYGFNKTSVRTYLLDMLKSTALALIIGAPVLAGILYLLQNAGTYAWLYGWGGITAFSMIMQYIAPKYIMPLFNKFTPIPDGELKEGIYDLAKKADFPLKNVFVMDGSKRSTKSNAFFGGFGKNKMIALFDTLIEKHTKDELIAVLAHEIGHYKKKHVIKGMIISILHTGMIFALLQAFLTMKPLYDAFYMNNMPIYAGLVFFGFLYSPIEKILSVFMSIMSRKHEFEADKMAAELTGRPQDLVSALKKLSVDNLSNLTPHPFYVFVNYSHPPVIERIKKLKGNY